MSAPAADPFLTALRQAKLLDPAELDELAAWADRSLADTQAIVAELLRRGRLTPFQAREVHRGRGAALTLGRYVLLDRIGEGGMGRVFKARDARLGREVALKVMRPEKVARPNVRHRFHQEMQAAGKLSHPNVVLALDAGEANGIHYISMEYVEGIDLTRLVASRGPLEVPQACDYVRQAARGLQHAADQGLVHRDVKPSNLLVTPRGQVKVLDLGLAMLKGGPGDGRVTRAGLVLGTPDFLAPEQARDPLGVDTRADVYGLGATLYYLLTGQVPFDGPSPAEKVVQHVTAPPPSARDSRPDVPPQLDAIIKWMMAKQPDDRPQTPAQASLALAPFCAPPAQADEPWGSPPRTASRGGE
ncbi:MAG TPA: serine/threonine-protein kinase, partial [Fimbriiglobus sp.]|nr:serine/threonine-protein kinase [Fimbriiglobus sp.]